MFNYVDVVIVIKIDIEWKNITLIPNRYKRRLRFLLTRRLIKILSQINIKFTFFMRNYCIKYYTCNILVIHII